MTGRALSVLLGALLTVFAAARPADAKLKVVTTTQDLASLATLVGGDRVEVFAIAKGFQDPHGVDAKPSLILKLASADLLVVIGLELESSWLPQLVEQSRNGRIRAGSPGYLDASVGCDVFQQAGTVTRAMGDVHPSGNPHYWTDPENGRVIARSIAARLSTIDPTGKEVFQKNLAVFEAKLTAKRQEWDALMAPWVGAKIVTFHDSWPNFAKRFRLEVAGHVEPKPGIPPSPSHTLATINLIRSNGIRVILSEPWFDQKTPKSIAEKSGATAILFYPSVGGRTGIDDYFQLFDANLAALVAALGAKK